LDHQSKFRASGTFQKASKGQNDSRLAHGFLGIRLVLFALFFSLLGHFGICSGDFVFFYIHSIYIYPLYLCTSVPLYTHYDCTLYMPNHRREILYT